MNGREINRVREIASRSYWFLKRAKREHFSSENRCVADELRIARLALIYNVIDKYLKLSIRLFIRRRNSI